MMEEIKKDSTQDLLKKAEQLRLGGYYDLARSALEELIRQNPFFAPAKLGLGRVFFESGDLANARSVLEEFAEFVPDHSLANKILAKIYIHFSQFEKAREKINMVLSVTPADSIAKKMLLEIDEEDRFLEEENLSDEDTKKSTAPTNTATIAEIYWAQGHVKEALEIYKELLMQDSGNILYQQKIAELENHVSAKFQEAETAELDPIKYQEDAAQAPTSEILELKSESTSEKKSQKEKLERMLSLIQKNRRT